MVYKSLDYSFCILITLDFMKLPFEKIINLYAI